MNPLDWMLALLLTYSAVKAFLQGFFREAFALGGLVVGLFAASWFYKALAVRLAGLLTTPTIAQLAAFLLILAGVMVLASICGRLMQKTASAVGLGVVDRMGGAAFGLVRGCLLGTAILMAVTAFLPAAPWIANSLLAPYFLRAAHAISFVVPADLNHRLMEGMQHIKHTSPDWIKQGSS